MQLFYIAEIVPEDVNCGGGYSAHFPDMPTVAAVGKTIEEVISNAADGLYVALRGIAERNEEMPAPSSLDEVKARVKAGREQAPCPEGTLYQYIIAPSLGMFPVRINVTVPMQKFYIAGIVPEDVKSGGGYSVYLPDVPMVAAVGKTVEEAICNAVASLYVIAEHNREMPASSSLDEVKAKVKAEREQDELPYPEDTLYQYIMAPYLDMVPVRINVAIPKASLEEVDAKAKKYGYTRSEFLAHAALEYATASSHQPPQR